jgi:hypothetical protein
LPGTFHGVAGAGGEGEGGHCESEQNFSDHSDFLPGGSPNAVRTARSRVNPDSGAMFHLDLSIARIGADSEGSTDAIRNGTAKHPRRYAPVEITMVFDALHPAPCHRPFL